MRIDVDNIIQGISNFRGNVFPGQKDMYRRLVRDGQQPKALIIACADSRVSPEHITQTGPGELFVCRNAGNIIPPSRSRTAASPRPSSTRSWPSGSGTSWSAATRIAVR